MRKDFSRFLALQLLVGALLACAPAFGDPPARLGCVVKELTDQVGVYLVQGEAGSEPRKGDVVGVVRGGEKVGEATILAVGQGRFQISLKGDFPVRAGDEVHFVRSPVAPVQPRTPVATAASTGPAGQPAPVPSDAPRLEVGNVRIFTSGVGRVVTVEATVRNEGSVPVEQGTVACRLLTDGGYVRYTGSASVGRLEPGQAKAVRFDTGMSSPKDLNTSGTRFELEDTSPNRPAGQPVITYRVELTPSGPATAASGAPPATPAAVQGADLVVDSIAVTSAGDTPFTAKMGVVVRIGNRGNAAVRQAIQVSVAIDGSSHGSETIWNGLAAGASAPITLNLSEAYRSGNHTLTVTVDPANAIPEANEANNTGSRGL